MKDTGVIRQQRTCRGHKICEEHEIERLAKRGRIEVLPRLFKNESEIAKSADTYYTFTVED